MKAAFAAALFILVAGAVLIGLGMSAVGWTNTALAVVLGGLWGLIWVCGVAIVDGRQS